MALCCRTAVARRVREGEMSRILIRNGTIISMDPEIGDLPTGDLLIEGDCVLAVGEKLDAQDAEILDASGKIVIPGLINAHLHTWETALRGIGGDWRGPEYFRVVHANLAPRYTPGDTYLGNLLGTLNQIDSGTTTIFDWCHNNATPEHSDAAIDGLIDSGVRAVFGHGTVKPDPKEGEPHYSRIPHPREEIMRLRKERLSDDGGLVTLAMAILGSDYSTLEVTLHDFRLAREYGLLSSAHIWGTPDRLVKEGYHRLKEEGLLGPDHNIVHGNYLEDEELRVIVDAGVSVTATPAVEAQKHPAEPLTGRVMALGGRPSIGADIEIYLEGDMFYVMRFALQCERIFDNLAHASPESAGKKRMLTARHALEWATINNARALGLEERIGSLSPGKQADIVLLRAGDINMFPVNDPVQAVVFHAGRSNVDTVFVAGRRVKEGGRLLYSESDLASKKQQLADSGRRIMEEGGLSHLANSPGS